uniref:VCBS repeat-containing protein n=1 Tax=Gracilinema caldarium TaxID=215591 RepID=A0A7C3IJ65_9SPIR
MLYHTKFITRLDRYNSRIWLAALVVLCAPFLIACPMGTGGSTEPSSPKAKEILNELNVKEVNNPPALTTTATTGETFTITDPDSWQPLKKPYTVYNPTAQVLQLGISVSGSYSTLWGDNSTVYSAAYPFSGSGTTSWANTCAKRSVTADLDGDGIDEWVIFYTPTNGGTSLYMTVGRHTATTAVSFSTPQQISGITASDKLHNYYEQSAFFINSIARNTRYPYFQMSSADIDGDGKEEILLVNYNEAVILKVSADGSSASIIDSKTFTAPVSSFTGGDFDGDRKDELVVCVQGKGFALYDSTFSSPVTNPEFMTPGFNDSDWSGVNWSDVVSQACFGDFNGDNIDELAVKVTGPKGWITKTYQVNKGTLEAKIEIWDKVAFPDSMTNIANMPVAVDIDGDGTDELFLAPYISSNVLGSSDSSVYIGNFLPNADYIIDAGAGDVDADGKKDMVVAYYLTNNNNAYSRITSFGMIAGDNWNNLETKKLYVDDTIINGADAQARFTHAVVETCMAIGHGFDNSPRVKYVGHELQFTDPIVIAVLASPPYYADIAAADPSYAYNSWVTTFGKKTSESASNTTKVGFSLGASLEYEGGASIFGVKIATFKASASFENSMNWEWTTSTTITKSITYTCNGGEDRVIFTAVPIDTYSYEVLTSPQSDDVGKILHINLPRDYSTYTVTREFFNEHNGTLADIGSNVLPHTLGQVKSYPTAATKDTLLSTYGGYSYDAQPAGQASVSNNGTVLEIEVEQGKEKSFSIDQERKFSVGAGAGGFVASIEAGFNVGYQYTCGTSTGTSFGGTVGYLPTTYFNNPNYTYSSGLFVYPYEDPNSLQTYWVVNYWVQ